MIAIIEDEILIADNLRTNLVDLGYKVLEPCISYKEVEEMLAYHTPSIVLVDINLESDKSGFDVAKLLNEKDIPFIFLTSYTDDSTIRNASIYAPEGYIAKPYNIDTVKSTIEISLAKRNQQSDTATIHVQNKGITVSIKCKDILFVQSDHVYLEIITESNKYVTRSTMSKIQEKLNHPHFQQSHRGFIVNMNKVEAFVNETLHIGDYRIPVSRKFRAQIKSYLS